MHTSTHTQTHSAVSPIYSGDNSYQLFKQQTSKFQCYSVLNWILCINIIPVIEAVHGS